MALYHFGCRSLYHFSTLTHCRCLQMEAEAIRLLICITLLNRRSMKLIGLTVFLVAVSILIPLPVPPVINAVMTLFVIPTSIILMISNLPSKSKNNHHCFNTLPKNPDRLVHYASVGVLCLINPVI